MKRLFAVAALIGSAILSSAALASPVWQATDNAQSWLDDNYSYVDDFATFTEVVTYTNQTATNIGSTGQRMGMYFGWNWIYSGPNGATSTALAWSNAEQAFVGTGVKMTISRPGHANQYVRIGDVQNDAWLGVPYAAWPGDAEISTEADWEVPVIDFGWLDAGASMNYDLEFTFVFDDLAGLQNFYSYFSSAQGLQAVPEPAGLALCGIALLAAAGAGRRRNKR